jgi:hypothetical protein
VKHAPELPHDQESLYYKYRFYGVRGRWPTWADAVAHCIPGIRSHVETELRRIGQWSEPEKGEPIADPPQESVRQPIGDIASNGFGPEYDAYRVSTKTAGDASYDREEGENVIESETKRPLTKEELESDSAETHKNIMNMLMNGQTKRPVVMLNAVLITAEALFEVVAYFDKAQQVRDGLEDTQQADLLKLIAQCVGRFTDAIVRGKETFSESKS